MKEFTGSALGADDQLLSVEILSFEGLSDRERDIFARRHGFVGDVTGLSAIAGDLSLSREAVRQLAGHAESKVSRTIVKQRVLPVRLRRLVERCACGKYRGPRFPGIVCERCGTTVGPPKAA